MAEASIATLTLKSDCPARVARFWRDLLGHDVAPNHSGSIMLVARRSAHARFGRRSRRSAAPVPLAVRPRTDVGI